LASLGGALGVTRPALGADDEGSESKSDESKSDESKDEESADEETKADESKDASAKGDAFGHGGQVGLRIGVVGGYRMILRYDDSPLCRAFDPNKGTEQAKFCGHVAPFALMTGLSYGLADWLEPFAWARFGLEPEPETHTDPVLMFGAGVRIYTMSDAPFKIFIEPAIGLEIEDGRATGAWQGADYPTDLVLHLAAGPTFDFARYVGAYLTGGITMGVVRSLHSSLEAELGIQGRYP